MERLHFRECFSSYSEDFSFLVIALVYSWDYFLCCLGLSWKLLACVLILKYFLFYSSSFHILGLGLKVFVNPFRIDFCEE